MKLDRSDGENLFPSAGRLADRSHGETAWQSGSLATLPRSDRLMGAAFYLEKWRSADNAKVETRSATPQLLCENAAWDSMSEQENARTEKGARRVATFLETTPANTSKVIANLATYKINHQRIQNWAVGHPG